MPELIPAEPRTPEWHAARRQGVTATDIVTILGLSSYDSVYSLFWRKLGQVPEVEDSDRFRLGRELEPIIAGRWEEEAGRHVWPGGLYRHTNRAWQLATLDRRDVDKPFELKSWADADRHSWQDGPPARVRAQVLWQMDVMDVATGHVGVVFLPSGEFRSYTIEHDDASHVPCPCPIRMTGGLRQSAPTSRSCAGRVRSSCGGCGWSSPRPTRTPPRPPWRRCGPGSSRSPPSKPRSTQIHRTSRGSAPRKRPRAGRRMSASTRSQIREQAGEAAELCVDGQLVARRVIVDAKVKAHVRHQDYLRRVEPKEDDSDVRSHWPTIRSTSTCVEGNTGTRRHRCELASASAAPSGTTAPCTG